MLPIETILHPTDFSDHSDYALRLGCSLARDYGARMILLHVVVRPVIAYGEGVVPPEPEVLYDEAWRQLNGLNVPAEIRAERQVLEAADAADQISRFAGTEGADLIVMGTHGRTGFGRLLMGSVAEHVLRIAPCPVLTVRTPFLQLERESRETVAHAAL